jgi:CheY-like chemotaxis protein
VESKVGIYSITAVAEMTGLSPTTLRYWERAYGLIVPMRTEGGHRLYSEEDVARLKWLAARIEQGLQAGAAHRLLESELREPGEAEGTGRGRGSILVLVAERDRITAELEEYFLRKEGYDVYIVLDGRKAIEEAEKHRPDLIIVDIVLPGLNGLKVCQALKANPLTAPAPVLVFSALDLRDRALAAGADAFLLKPLEEPELIEQIKRLLIQVGGKAHAKGAGR